jgi:heterodisulfide reductase subunit B
MEYAFFLGCIAPNRYPGLESATHAVAEILGIQLKDMKGASCCPAPGVFKSFSKEMWLSTGARNLSIAESLNADILTVCNGCYSTLKEVNNELKTNMEIRNQVNNILKEIGRSFQGKIQVRHLVEILYHDIGLEKIKENVKKQLNLNVAVHYGCHLLKPTKQREIKDAEHPKFLDELVEVLGAKSVPYKDRMMCCGAGGGVRSARLDISLDVTMEKLKNMKEPEVDCIVTPCSFCHLQFDRGQIEIRDQTGVFFNIPVLHYVQLLGLAFDIPLEKLGMRYHAVDTEPVLKKIQGK